MSLPAVLRSHLFWATDFFKGGCIRQHYKNIRWLMEKYDSGKAYEYRSLLLKRLLLHAVETSPFYRKYKGFTTFNDFPVINKSVIKEYSDSFISDSYYGRKVHKITTSGSTGAPLSVVQNKTKRERHIAENIYFTEIAGAPLGTKLYYLRVWNELNRKSRLRCFMQNMVMVDADDISDWKFNPFLFKLQNDHERKYILAFASTLEAFSQFLRDKQQPLDIRTNCIIAISETLPEGARQILQKKFSCPVISRYSNMENGFLAQQCGHDSGEYHINTASYYIELLHPDKDEQAEPGKTGRIVVTDLFNYAMPIIRYDTGDMAIYSENSFCGNPGPVFTSVEGRRVDYIYNTAGRLLSPHVVTNTMWKYSAEVKQFQFIQKGQKDYLLKLNTGTKYPLKTHEIINDLKKYTGEDSEISVEFVEEIPVLGSGKRKKIVNEYKKF